MKMLRYLKMGINDTALEMDGAQVLEGGVRYHDLASLPELNRRFACLDSTSRSTSTRKYNKIKLYVSVDLLI